MGNGGLIKVQNGGNIAYAKFFNGERREHFKARYVTENGKEIRHIGKVCVRGQIMMYGGKGF